MNRRRFLSILAAVPAVAAAGRAAAQDRDWLRAWEAAQRGRPAAIKSAGRIAPAGEPGTPLVIDGRVLRADGRTPVPDVIVFAYQTDQGGLYDLPSRGAHSWRLKGWARTSADGRFTFHTIRPGAYPNARVPQHVHFTIEAPAHGRQYVPELRFADDYRVFANEREQSTLAKVFGWVRPVRTIDGAARVDFAIKLDPDERF